MEKSSRTVRAWHPPAARGAVRHIGGGRPGHLLVAIAALFTAACIYDADDRCGENQVYQDDVCLCVEGAVKVDSTCELCAANEVPFESECVCVDGYIRDARGVCVLGAAGLGDACTGDDDCPEGGASYCATDSDGSFCTLTGCETGADCPEGFGCDISLEDGVCLRPPSGYGTPCEDSSECADFGANYCETAQAGACMVECASDPGSCHGDFACCDFRNLIGAAICIPPTELTSGACPYGVDRLEAN